MRSSQVFITLAIIFSSLPIFPWGNVGHRTVAFIAEKNLSAGTLEKMKPILGGETLEYVSIWADMYKRNHRNTASWHYINLPVRQKVTASDIPKYYSTGGHSQADNVVSQIKIDIEILKDSTASFPEKQMALKFLVHFVGDIHMPLHVGDDNDAGGNDKRVRFFSPISRSNKGHVTNLHSLWDNLIEVKAAEDPIELGDELNSKISASEKRKWDTASVEDWAMESYSIARNVIYKGFKAGPGETAVPLPRDYYSRMRPIVDLRLEEAGVRLANVLNTIFE